MLLLLPGRCLPSLAKLALADRSSINSIINSSNSITSSSSSSSSTVLFPDSPTGQVNLETLEVAVQVILTLTIVLPQSFLCPIILCSHPVPQALSKALGLRNLGDKVLADLAASW